MVATRSPSEARPTTLARELERLLAEVAGSVDDVVSRAQPSPESLHELHREMRRLRHALSIWLLLLATRHQELIRPLDRRLKRLARLVGRVRDRDVMLGLIEGPSLPRPSRQDAERVTRLRARLRDDARTGRELLRVFLRSERDDHLFEGLRESLEFIPRRAPVDGLTHILDDELARRHDDVRRAHRKAGRRATSVRLHHLRIEVRRLRHLTEVRRALERQNGREFPLSVRQLQSRLGRLHDLDVVLGGLDSEVRSTDWARSLRRERKRVRQALRTTLRKHGWPKGARPHQPLAAPVGRSPARRRGPRS